MDTPDRPDPADLAEGHRLAGILTARVRYCDDCTCAEGIQSDACPGCWCHDPEHDADPEGADPDPRACLECGCIDPGAPDPDCEQPAGCCHRGVVAPRCADPDDDGIADYPHDADGDE